MRGECIEVGCDGRIGSQKRLGKCGVCDGNGSTCHNSLQIWTPNQGFKTRKGYVKTKLVIPKGARNVQLKTIKASNYILTLKNKDHSKSSGSKSPYFIHSIKSIKSTRNHAPHYSSRIEQGNYFQFNKMKNGWQNITAVGPLHFDVAVYF